MYTAFGAARAFVQSDGSRAVPLRLRNAPTKLMKDLDYGKGYRYAHDEPDAYAAGEHYFPDDLPQQRFYEPVAQGVEIRIRERLAQLRAADQYPPRQARATTQMAAAPDALARPCLARHTPVHAMPALLPAQSPLLHRQSSRSRVVTPVRLAWRQSAAHPLT